MKLETIAIHAGGQADENFSAVIPPIVLSTTFERNADNEYPHNFSYGRAGNPNRTQLENVLARLEQGAAAAAFSSGNAAGMAVFQSLPAGSHVILPADMYHGLRNQVLTLFDGILEALFIDLNDSELLQGSIRDNTRLIWVETPSNPQLILTNIKQIVTVAKPHNIKVVCDNTFATPVGQQPLTLGADMVMHSTTKYLGGHSDLTGGALITAQTGDWWNKILAVQQMGGAVPAPADCYWLTRSIKTLPYRMRGHVHNAQLLAEWLQAQPQVERVMYPGLPSHPQHNLATEQMLNYGGMLSFLVKGTKQDALLILKHLKLFADATSLGGVESLIEHRASTEGPDSTTPQNLLRVSVGLEHIDDLIADMSQAFAKAVS